MPIVWCLFARCDASEERRLLRQVTQRLSRIERKQDTIMGLVAIEQGDLDAIAVTITQVAETLQAVLDSDTPLSPADESGVQSALTKLQAVGPRVPTDAPSVPASEDPGNTPATPTDSTPVEVTPEPPVDSTGETGPADSDV